MSRCAIVVGRDGRLGRALCAQLARAGYEVISTSRRDSRSTGCHLDLLDPRLPTVPWSSSKVVVFIVAAMTGIAQCESDPHAWRVNADAPCVLTAVARCWGWDVVFVSSDAVEKAPHTAYAMQKAHAESVVLALGGMVFRPARIAPERYDAAAAALIAASEGVLDRRMHGRIVRWEG